MQPIRGTKDILPDEIKSWQKLYLEVLHLFNIYNYYEIRTPIIENSEVFLKSVGNDTDIINKEMYRFQDQGQRDITLRPEGTACIARAIVSNQLYNKNPVQKLWYMGPMFRYERPQYGRQRQFHQLGIECIGSEHPLADAEVINIANRLLTIIQFPQYIIEINSLGTLEERKKYTEELTNFFKKYENDLDYHCKQRLRTNPLRILDSKDIKIQEMIQYAPHIAQYLQKDSKKHFDLLCEYLNSLNITYRINRKLVRGLDYYSHTTFEIISNKLDSNNTICGGGRYSNLIKQFGGPNITGVGWAIGIERLLMLNKKTQNIQNTRIEIITEGHEAKKQSWYLIQLLEKHHIAFNLQLNNQSFQKQIKKAIQNKALACLIIGRYELETSTVTIKWLNEHYQETINIHYVINYLQNKLQQNKRL